MSALYPNASLPMPTQFGTVQVANPFNPEQAAGGLRKAMKGLGTDEDAVIAFVTSHCVGQRCEIEKQYKQMFGRDLRSDLKSELSGKFEDTILRLFDPPRVFDAMECNNAIKGLGTNEDTLIEILSTRSNAEILEIRSQYKILYKRELEKDIQGDTSGHFKRLLTALVTGHREERPQADHQLACQEAEELYKAGEKQLGTDESTFNRILCLRSPVQLRETFAQYRAISGKEIEQSIQSEMSGNLELGCLAIVKSANNPAAFYAERLYKSMKGAGTDDRTLIRCVISRSEVDMKLIKQEFNTMYGKTLGSFIKGDTSGDYKKTLLSLIGEPK